MPNVRQKCQLYQDIHVYSDAFIEVTQKRRANQVSNRQMDIKHRQS